MKEFVCNYAAIRFLPYRETGEFVNVGVVIYCPELDFFDFRISKRRHARIKHFFPELDSGILSTSVEALRHELQRRRRSTGTLFARFNTREELIRNRIEDFRCFVRRKESLLHFSDMGMMMSADPVQAAKKLYDRYVERDFAQPKEYQEQVMRRRLSEWLQEWDLKARYTVDERIGSEEFHVRLPFVHRHNGRAVKALKPLDLAKGEPTSIYEHGDAWVSRMHRLHETKHLPDRVVFTVNLPETGVRRKAADQILEGLEKLQVVVVPFDEKERIRELAKI